MKSLVGGILSAVGILIAGGSGLCSLTMLVVMMRDIRQAAGGAILVLVFGGIPFLIGVGLFWAGRSLLKSERRKVEPDGANRPDT